MAWSKWNNAVGRVIVHRNNQPCIGSTTIVPQRLVVWRLAKENILRRKRQAALLMAGLVIASAIITFSLVVGDSLDATITQEVEGAWGKQISHYQVLI